MEEHEFNENVDSELVEKMRDYEQNKDGVYRSAWVAEIIPDGEEIHMKVASPNISFTESFAWPSPDTKRFEKVAEKYGVGLIDISELHGEEVLCEKVNGEWQIAVNTGRAHRFKRKLLSYDYGTFVGLLIFSLLAPIAAVFIYDKKWDREMVYQKRKREMMPEAYNYHDPLEQEMQEMEHWAQGVVSMCIFIMFWAAVVYFLFV